MIRKAFRTGNTLAVSMPQSVAEALGIQDGDYVVVEHDPGAGAMLVWPRATYARGGVDSTYVRAVADFLHDYGPALAALDAT